MTVYVTRHGQPDYDVETALGWWPLTPLGRRQADRLGHRLRELGFSGRILSSPFHRCLETADRIATVLATSFVPEPLLTERSGDWVDDFTGIRDEEIPRIYARCAAGVELPWPWWPQVPEEPEDVYARVEPLVARVLAGEAGDEVLLVGHGASAMGAVWHLAGARVSHHNATLSAVRVDPEPELLFANDAAHLQRGELTANRKVIR